MVLIFLDGIKMGINNTKFITVLKGPDTLLIKSTKEIKRIYNDILKKTDGRITRLSM